MEARKLKYLTLASLAARHGEVEYSVLHAELEVGELRELEDLVLDAIYQGLIGGKIDQQKQRVVVDFAIGRDVRDADLRRLQSVLDKWVARSATLINVIDEKIKVARSEIKAEQLHREDFEQRVKDMKENIRAIMEAQEAEQRMGGGKRVQGGPGMMHGGGGQRRGGDPRGQGRPGAGFKQGFFN